MRLLIQKGERSLTLTDGAKTLLRARVGLGRCPQGGKAQAGDGRTPEGVYRICLVKPEGKYGRSLSVSYPNAADANAALAQGRIGEADHAAILSAQREGRRPPWGTALGGEIYIHEGGAHADWTEGCIALDSGDMDTLYPCRALITEVEIRP